jgi:dipeptidyl aminopeptidase/acylaminoacyl peptidase
MKYFFFLVILFPGVSTYAQDGKILERTRYTVSDTVPGASAIMAAVDFYRITYLSDGFKVIGYLAIPKKDGTWPCVIFNRGGNQEFSKITDESFIRAIGPLSSKGYVVVASQYRGNDGGEGKEEFGGQDVHDVLNLLPLLGHCKQADTGRIGMFGWSRGGMMTYLALTKTTKIKAAVVGSGLTDLVKTLEARPGFDSLWSTMIPGYAQNKTAALQQRSATYFAEKINRTTPILILQGSADWRVPTGQVLDLVNKFYQLKQPCRFILYEGGQHSLIEHRTNYYQQMIDWFDTYLRDKKTWPDMTPHGN